MDMKINGYEIHLVAPVIRRGRPDGYYIVGTRAEDGEAVCAYTVDLSADHWSSGRYYPIPRGGDADKALAAAIEDAYMSAGVLPEQEQREKEAADMRELLDEADEAAEGDSNDEEINTLRAALDHAMTRWPELANPIPAGL